MLMEVICGGLALVLRLKPWKVCPCCLHFFVNLKSHQVLCNEKYSPHTHYDQVYQAIPSLPSSKNTLENHPERRRLWKVHRLDLNLESLSGR